MDRIDTMQAIADANPDAKRTPDKPHATKGLLLAPGTVLPNGSMFFL